MYVVVAVEVTSAPVLSTPTGAVNDTPTPFVLPLNVGSGLNVTTPVVGLIVYVPSFSTVTDSTSELSVGLINFAG